MKEILLTNSCKLAMVDDEDYERCSKINWSLNGKGYIFGSVYGEVMSLHRFICFLFNDDKRIVDHEDRNKLNCQRYNLRICNRTQNQANSRKYKNGTSSKYKGVSYHVENRNWFARIVVNGKAKFLGSYWVEEEAARAYNVAALEAFGEFARLNSL